MKRAIEAVVLVADEPVEAQLLAELLELPPAIVEELCRELTDEYQRSMRGFVLARVAGGYRYETHPDLAPYVERYALDGQASRLSAAALETLSIVAYKQPVSRAQVAAIRGVAVDGVMRTLTQRDLIAEVARDPGPGQAVLYGTTRHFLERLGLHDLSQLPPLGAFVPSPDVVEALEHGLRFAPDEPDPDAPTGPVADDDAPADRPTEETTDGPVDGVTIDGISIDDLAIDGVTIDGSPIDDPPGPTTGIDRDPEGDDD